MWRVRPHFLAAARRVRAPSVLLLRTATIVSCWTSIRRAGGRAGWPRLATLGGAGGDVPDDADVRKRELCRRPWPRGAVSLRTYAPHSISVALDEHGALLLGASRASDRVQRARRANSGCADRASSASRAPRQCTCCGGFEAWRGGGRQGRLVCELDSLPVGQPVQVVSARRPLEVSSQLRRLGHHLDMSNHPLSYALLSLCSLYSALHPFPLADSLLPSIHSGRPTTRTKSRRWQTRSGCVGSTQSPRAAITRSRAPPDWRTRAWTSCILMRGTTVRCTPPRSSASHFWPHSSHHHIPRLTALIDSPSRPMFSLPADKGVLADLNAYWPKLRRGGIMAGCRPTAHTSSALSARMWPSTHRDEKTMP